MRLDALPVDLARRVEAALNAASWTMRCGDAKIAQWVTWNVTHDAWHTDKTLTDVCAAICLVDEVMPGLEGAELLAECAHLLQRVRVLDVDECAHLPPCGVTHVMTRWCLKKYDLAPESAYAEGSAPGELDPTLLAGERIRVLPRGPAYFRWLTFDAGSGPVGKVPDEVVRGLGLAWKPAHGSVVRIEVPIDTIVQAGAMIVIPTFFDGFNPGPPVIPDWRARPEREHRAGEPWGYARDMRDDGPGLPEIIADIKAASRMNAEILGPVTVDWTTRPYLAGAGPR